MKRLFFEQLLPALSGAKGSAKRIACLNHEKQLSLALRMYADDNNGRLVYNRDGGNVGKGRGDW